MMLGGEIISHLLSVCIEISMFPVSIPRLSTMIVSGRV